MLGAVLWYYARELPTVESLRNYSPTQVTQVYDRNDKLIGELFKERRTLVPMSRVPRVVVLAMLAAEDADFYRHEGLDYPGILRAMFHDVLSGRPRQGASTITQQVIKNLLLSHERTLKRKLKELVLTRRLEQELTKDEILHLYFNSIYFGHGRYGIQEAARYYFDKNVSDLSLAEAALIAGVPQAPARLSPRTHPDAAKQRQAFVLNQLEQKRAAYWPDLSIEEIEAARHEKIELRAASEAEDRAPELMQYVERMLRHNLGEDAVKKGGLRITTTVDIELQARARSQLQAILREYDKRHGLRPPYKAALGSRKKRRKQALKINQTYKATVVDTDDKKGLIFLDIHGNPAVLDLNAERRYNPKGRAPGRFALRNAELTVIVDSLSRSPSASASSREQRTDGASPPAQVRLALGPQGAVIVMNPGTREVLAMVGGYQDVPGFDRATQAIRQPGSAFKPILYAYAMKSRRFTPASVVLDAPEVFDQYQPQNYETWHFEGAVRLRYALAKSINLVAIRLIEQLGPENIVHFARLLGIQSRLEPTLPLALGASGVTPLELSNAYASFAAGGIAAPPKIISKVLDTNGKPLPWPPDESREVLTPAEAYVMTSMLTSVVEFGTATAARALDCPVAAKTGTSNRARDVWLVGYTPNLLAGVWLGYDDNRSLGRGESGGGTALPLWIKVMKDAGGEKPSCSFAVPSGVERVLIDPASGKLAYPGMPDAIEEVFVEGTVPTETVLDPSLADPKTFLMEQAAETGEQ
ncbi:MAG: PBP1A family penicillin-binding protein [Myxococcales bacterium]|nr:PBP1A family penicillin-binding protein [Myxococcales bacterium]